MNFIQRLGSALKRRVFDRPKVLFFSGSEKAASFGLRLELDFPPIDELSEILVKLPEFKTQHALYLARYLAGDQLCIGSLDGKIVHMSWFGAKEKLEADYELGPGLPWILENKSAVIYDCWTAPSHRGMGLYPGVLGTLKNSLLDDFPEVWIYCREENVASRRGIEKAGFHYRGSLSSLMIFGKYFHV